MMGGSAVQKTKKKIKNIKVENAAKAIINPINAASALGFKKSTGVKADAIIAPLSTQGGNLGESQYDKPLAEAKQFADDAAGAAVQQAKNLKDIKARAGQEDAESKAAENLNKGKARQRRKSRKSGRSSTILTKSLGGVGSDSQPRKNLLGL